MNLLLINPWIYDFAAFDLWIKPLGLLHIASFLEKFGYKIYLIDCLDRHEPLLKKIHKKLPKANEFDCGKFFSEEVEKPYPLKDVPRKYKRYGIPMEVFEEKLSRIPYPDAVGITSSMTYWYHGVFEAIKKVKEKFPSTPVILGGIYATLCYEHAKKHSGADYVVRGEGEMAVLKILDKIGRVKRNYSKIPWQKIKENTPPAYHLIPQARSAAILTSKGCPFKCSYCASPILEKCFAQQEPERVLKKIEYLAKDVGIKDIAFYDDALLVNAKRHIIPILEGVVKKFKREVRFHTPNGLHIKFIDGKIANLFHAANFKTIRLSFESIDPQIQKNSSGKTSKEDLIKAVENLVRAGYKEEDLGVYIMVGLPNQGTQEVVKTIEFVKKTGARIKIAEFSPIPGTPEFKKATKESFLPLKGEPLYHNNSCFYLWNKKISYEDLVHIKNLVKK